MAMPSVPQKTVQKTRRVLCPCCPGGHKIRCILCVRCVCCVHGGVVDAVDLCAVSMVVCWYPIVRVSVVGKVWCLPVDGGST